MADMIGPYRLESVVGRGGMGEVFRAYDTEQDDRLIALKLLNVELSQDADFRARFRREAQIASKLEDPHVVPIYRYGEIDNRLFLAMRFVDGEDLAVRLGRTGALELGQAVNIIEQVASALDGAHRLGLVHRDVKPSNVLLAASRDDSGLQFAYLTDFGVARGLAATGVFRTRTGVTVGTLAYMSPEQFEPGPVTAAADVYALGCLLFETMTGRTPFPGDTLPILLRAHLTSPPPKISDYLANFPALDEIVARAMAKNPVDRFRTAGELAKSAREAALGSTERFQSNISKTVDSAGASADPVTAEPPVNRARTTEWRTVHEVEVGTRPGTSPPSVGQVTKLNARADDAAAEGSTRRSRRIPKAAIGVSLVVVAGLVATIIAANAGTGPVVENPNPPSSQTVNRSATIADYFVPSLVQKCQAPRIPRNYPGLIDEKACDRSGQQISISLYESRAAAEASWNRAYGASSDATSAGDCDAPPPSDRRTDYIEDYSDQAGHRGRIQCGGIADEFWSVDVLLDDIPVIISHSVQYDTGYSSVREGINETIAQLK